MMQPASNLIRAELAAVGEDRTANRHAVARTRLAKLAERYPQNARILLELAFVEDYLGHSSAAIEHYYAALAVGLPKAVLRDAYLGLGSTLRALGRYAESLSVFEEALTRFPRARELILFRAMTLHNLRREKEAFEIVLTLLAKTTADRDIKAFGRALLFYAKDISRIWPGKT